MTAWHRVICWRIYKSMTTVQTRGIRKALRCFGVSTTLTRGPQQQGTKRLLWDAFPWVYLPQTLAICAQTAFPTFNLQVWPLNTKPHTKQVKPTPVIFDTFYCYTFIHLPTTLSLFTSSCSNSIIILPIKVACYYVPLCLMTLNDTCSWEGHVQTFTVTTILLVH